MILTHINLARGFRGGERQTELLIRELAALGMPQRAILRRDEPLVTRLSDVPNLERRPIGKPFLAHVGQARGGFLHAHDGHGAHFAYRASRWVNARYVITRRVDNQPSGRRATQAMFEKADGVAVLSNAIDRVMRAYRPGLVPIKIPSAAAALVVDSARAARLRRDWGDDYVVGQVGALDDSQKGQYDTLTAAKQLIQEDKTWRFVFVGGGKNEPDLRAATRDWPNIELTGHVDNVGDYLSAFDSFVFPSRHEGLGSTLLDAMQAGLPIVATNVDGIPELIEHETNGLLVAPGQPYALVGALRYLRDDPEQAARLGAVGRERVAGYTGALMAARYSRWYAQLGADITSLPYKDRST